MSCLLIPLVYPISIYLRYSIPLLPEAPGPRSGQYGHGKEFQLLTLGESPVAGATLKTQSETVTAQLARVLATNTSHEVHWQSLGKSGAKIEDLSRLFAEKLPPLANLIIISMGVNDTKGLTSVTSWITNWQKLLDILQVRYQNAPIVICSIPPMRSFPSLPWPVRVFLGAKADLLDAYLQRLIDKRANCHFIPLPFRLHSDYFAIDGFHPNAQAHLYWALQLYKQMMKNNIIG